MRTWRIAWIGGFRKLSRSRSLGSQSVISLAVNLSDRVFCTRLTNLLSNSFAGFRADHRRDLWRNGVATIVSRPENPGAARVFANILRHRHTLITEARPAGNIRAAPTRCHGRRRTSTPRAGIGQWKTAWPSGSRSKAACCAGSYLLAFDLAALVPAFDKRQELGAKGRETSVTSTMNCPCGASIGSRLREVYSVQPSALPSEIPGLPARPGAASG